MRYKKMATYVLYVMLPFAVYIMLNWIGLFGARYIIVENIVIKKPTFFHIYSMTLNFKNINARCGLHLGCTKKVKLEDFESFNVIYRNFAKEAFTVGVQSFKKKDKKLLLNALGSFEEEYGSCLVRRKNNILDYDKYYFKTELFLLDEKLLISILSKNSKYVDQLLRSICYHDYDSSLAK